MEESKVNQTTSKTLDQFDVDEEGVVTSVAGDGHIRRRLLDMGITPGAKVLLRKKAPLGDPIQINLRGYELSLRKVEAKNITLKMTLTTQMIQNQQLEKQK